MGNEGLIFFDSSVCSDITQRFQRMFVFSFHFYPKGVFSSSNFISKNYLGARQACMWSAEDGSPKTPVSWLPEPVKTSPSVRSGTLQMKLSSGSCMERLSWIIRVQGHPKGLCKREAEGDVVLQQIRDFHSFTCICQWSNGRKKTGKWQEVHIFYFARFGDKKTNALKNRGGRRREKEMEEEKQIQTPKNLLWPSFHESRTKH